MPCCKAKEINVNPRELVLSALLNLKNRGKTENQVEQALDAALVPLESKISRPEQRHSKPGFVPSIAPMAH
jgi:hypothetical protein